MVNNLTTIVEELIALDPSLRENQVELERALARIIEAKPNTKFSNAFKNELFAELSARFTPESSEVSSSLFSMAHKWLFGAGGAVLGALLVAVIQFSQQDSFFAPQAPSMDGAEVAMEAGESTVSTTGRQAFGSLAVTDNAANPAPSTLSVDTKMRPQSGGGGGAAEADAMIYPYNPTTLEYTFEGEYTLPVGDVSVLRRVKDGTLPSNVSALISGFSSKLLNWSAFSGVKARMVNLVESGNEPFNITIDYVEGTVSMYKEYNWANRPDANCQDEACYARYRIKESDMPSDEAAIGMADSFLRSHGINTENYGTPVVEDQWRFWLARSTDRMAYYYPESINVIYPFLINGKPVYEEYGNVVGLSVTIDVRHDEVSGLYNLQTLDLQSSDYAAVSDKAKFDEFVKRGGINVWIDPSVTSKVSGTLGTPTDVYVRIWKWNESAKTNTELYVPALAFPVTSTPEEVMQDRKFVVIPLADELLTSNNGGAMPLMMDGGPAVSEPAIAPDSFPTPDAVIPGPGTDGIEE